MSADPVGDEPTIRRFLTLLHSHAAAALSHERRPGELQLVSMAPDDSGMSVSPFEIGDVDHMAEAALVDARAGRNVYVETRTVRPGRPNERGRGKIESTIACFAFVIDRDNDTGKAGHINRNDTTIVETSPGNSHEWLFLDRALNAAEAKAIGEHIRKAAGADHDTGVITQPYRVPGTPNYPGAKKRTRGRIVVPTRLIRVSNKVWTPGEIRAVFSVHEAQAAKPQSTRKFAGKRNGPVHRTPSTSAAVKRKVAAKATVEMDRSAQFQSAVNAAARSGMEPDQLEALMRAHPDGCASKYLKGGDRLRQEIDRSWLKVEHGRGSADDHGLGHRGNHLNHDRHAGGDPDRYADRGGDHVRGHAEDRHVGDRCGRDLDGVELLDRVYEFLGRFVVYPSSDAQVAHTLWIAHTHLMDCWETTPRLAFLSPEPASGKTRALEITELLVPRPTPAINVSPAYLVRKVEAEEGLPTVLFDEIDAVFGPKAREGNEDVRALLNAGYRRGATVGRCVMHGSVAVPEELPAFCAVALAGLGELPDTVLSRSIIIRMRRRAPNEPVRPYRRREHAREGELLRDRLRAWAAAAISRIAVPDMPAQVADRDADCWEPLIATAEAAGGHWPDTARCCAVALVELLRGDGEERLSIRLLSDMRAIFGNDEQAPTTAILDKLHKLDESPWADIRGKPLNDRGLAVRLRPYGINPCVIRVGSTTPRGYRREDFVDAWARYLPPSPPETAKQPQQRNIASML